MFHPPPRQPLPHGAIPCRYSATGEHPLTRFQARTPRRILFSPVTRHPNYRQTLARPLGRGRGDRRIPFNQRRERQGRGMFHPPPRQPHPHGAIPCRYSATGEISFSWFQAWNSPKNPVFPRGTASEPSPCTARLLGRGRAEARNAPGGGGVPAKTVQSETRATGAGDVPSPSPPPRGDSL